MNRPSKLEITKSWRILLALQFVVFGLLMTQSFRVNAEIRPPSGPDNGLTSHLVSLSNTLSGLGYGSTANTPDWGQYWNRISTAAQWAPSGNASTSDVVSGKTFYGNNRTQQTGTYPKPSTCSTQVLPDYHASATQASNCTADVVWTTPSDGITGNDKQDPRTGAIWSKPLANSSGTLVFVNSSPTAFLFNANSGVGNKTAIQICSSLGNGWHLPTQKEFMQAYIDGAYFNLTDPESASTWWISTTYPSAWVLYGYLSAGIVNNVSTDAGRYVRCVR